jgi:hypothetical protein
MKLREITSGQSLAGVEPAQIISAAAVLPHGDEAVQPIGLKSADWEWR